MEVLWKEWTGALYVYCNIDDELGLKRITFYRRTSPHRRNLFSYLVFVELDTVTRKNYLVLLDFVYRMRLRNMNGYISVYQSHSQDTEVNIVPGGSPTMSHRAQSPLGYQQQHQHHHLRPQTPNNNNNNTNNNSSNKNNNNNDTSSKNNSNSRARSPSTSQSSSSQSTDESNGDLNSLNFGGMKM